MISTLHPFFCDEGGLATGASQIKTMEQRSVFGGIANAQVSTRYNPLPPIFLTRVLQLDTCYHLPCDTPENVNAVVLQVRTLPTLCLMISILLTLQHFLA